MHALAELWADADGPLYARALGYAAHDLRADPEFMLQARAPGGMPGLCNVVLRA